MVAFVCFRIVISVISLGKTQGPLSVCWLVHDQHRVKKAHRYAKLVGAWQVHLSGSNLVGPARAEKLKPEIL